MPSQALHQNGEIKAFDSVTYMDWNTELYN